MIFSLYYNNTIDYAIFLVRFAFQQLKLNSGITQPFEIITVLPTNYAHKAHDTYANYN